MTRDRIAIIKLAVPDAKDAQTFWDNILDGHVAIWSRMIAGSRTIFSRTVIVQIRPTPKSAALLVHRKAERPSYSQVVEQMDDVQKLALTSFSSLEDAGLGHLVLEKVGFDRSETAVILEAQAVSAKIRLLCVFKEGSLGSIGDWVARTQQTKLSRTLSSL